jgi:hypothetical protein
VPGKNATMRHLPSLQKSKKINIIDSVMHKEHKACRENIQPYQVNENEIKELLKK